jgi:hypothetical protein
LAKRSPPTSFASKLQDLISYFDAVINTMRDSDGRRLAAESHASGAVKILEPMVRERLENS